MKDLLKDRKVGINFACVFIPLIIAYLLFAFSKINILEDYFNLYRIKNAGGFITTLLGTFATIISITVAIAILSFNTFKQKAGEYAIEYFTSIKYLHYLVSLYITAVFLILFSLIAVLKASNNTINLLYFNVYLFITAIILMVRFSYKLFNKISVSDLIQYYFFKIDRKKILNSPIAISSFKTLEQNINNPLLIIEDLGLNYLRRGDFVISNLVYTELSNCITGFIKETDESRDLELYLEYLIRVYKNFIPEAINKNNYILLSSIWTWFINIHNEINRDIKQLLLFWNYFKVFGCNYYQILIKANQYELAEEYFDSVFTTFHFDIEIIFPQEKEIHLFSFVFKERYKELYGECQDADFFKGINEDWQNFIEIFQSIYYSCGEYNLRTNNEIGLLSIIHQICRNTVFEKYSSQPLKRFYVYKKFYPLIREFLERGLDRKIFNSDMGMILNDINPLKIFHFRNKLIYENSILVAYGNLLVFLQKYNLVDHSVVGGLSIGESDILTGDLGELCHHYIHKNDEDVLNLECLKTLFDIISVLNRGFEKDLNMNKGLQFNLRERLLFLEEELRKKSNLPEKGIKLLAEIQDLILQINIVRDKLLSNEA